MLLAAGDLSPDVGEPPGHPAPAWPGSISLVAGSLVAMVGGLAALGIDLSSCPRLMAGRRCEKDWSPAVALALAGAFIIAFGVGWLLWATRE